MLDRRQVLGSLSLAALASTVVGPSRGAPAFEVVHSDAEWRKLLSADQFAVLRQAGTEQPFTSPLLKEHRKGVFACAGCGRDLFDSGTKFDSGTGWPSFWKPLPDAVIETEDRSFFMTRTAVCAAAAAGISATSSTTGRRRRGCAIA